MFAPAQILMLAAAAPWVAALAAETPQSREDQPIVIRADRAWEAAQDGADSAARVLRLQGNFEMRGTDWRVTADSAEVRGAVEDPEQLIIVGKPARIRFTSGDGDRVVGEGGRIVYWQQRGLLELHGNAALESGGLSLSNSKIVYDLKAQRLQSSGEGGVRFRLSQKGPKQED